MTKTHKSIVKYNKARHTKKLTTSNNSIDDSKKHKHSYYTIHCNKHFSINYKYLEGLLESLGVKRDSEAMNTIKAKDIKFFKSIRKPFDSYCESFTQLPKFNKNLVKADVFLVQTYNPVLKKRFYDYPKYFTNVFDDKKLDKFTNKNDILKEFRKISVRFSNKYIPETFNINDIAKYKFPKWYILRPIDGALGKDLFYVNNAKELNSISNYYKITKNIKRRFYGENVIASEYIINPLLFQGKKFHLRCYFVVSLTNNIFNSFLFDICRFMFAEKLFNMDSPFNNETHTTAGRYTYEDRYFPFDFNKENLGIDIDESKINKLWKHITNICRVLAKIFENNKDDLIYSNVKNAYNICAIDIIVRDDMIPAFIELNINPSISAINDIIYNMVSRILYKWINDTVLEPLFKYNDPMIARKHPTYIKPF